MVVWSVAHAQHAWRLPRSPRSERGHPRPCEDESGEDPAELPCAAVEYAAAAAAAATVVAAAMSGVDTHK